MQEVSFLHDLAVVMMAAGMVTLTFRILHQPVVLGYIFAGVLIGPHVLPSPLIINERNIQTLSELGIVFLLFSLGLEFNLRKLRQVGLTPFVVAPLETGLMFFLGYHIGQVFGWKPMDSVFLGAVLMVSSTTIITKTLTELKKTKEPFTEILFGLLLVEDVIAIVAVASLSGIAMTGEVAVGAVLATLGRLSIFLVVSLVFGLLLVPRLLEYVGKLESDETLLITVLGLCFGIALLALELGFSVALGSFIIGAVIAEAKPIRKIELLMGPPRDMFSAVFFVSIGLLIDPQLVRQYAVPVTVITLAVVFGKVVACSFGSFLAGHEASQALRVGLGMAQIGEFSFIIASLGASLGVTSHFLYPIAVTVSAITSALSPYLIRHADVFVRWHDRLAPSSLLNYQRDYLYWVKQVKHDQDQRAPRRLARKMMWQLGINVALISACFLAAVFVNQLRPAWFQGLPKWLGGGKTVLWLAAVLASLPIIIATLRKLQAMSLLISEMAIQHRPGVRKKLALRAMVANTTMFGGAVGLSLLVLVLSSALLPPYEVMLVLIGLAILIAILLHRFFIRVYARAQVAIQEVLSRERAEDAGQATSKPMPELLEEADLITVRVRAGSVAHGKRIVDLNLRRLTGASVVVVKRGSETIVNPGPELPLLEGDQVLLLGNAEQLKLAHELISGAGVGIGDNG